MIWDARSIRALSDIVDRKYDGEFKGDLAGWRRYLSEHGIARETWGVRSSVSPCVWIECPWSVSNSTPGALYSKSNIHFPVELAEKIVVLGCMP